MSLNKNILRIFALFGACLILLIITPVIENYRSQSSNKWIVQKSSELMKAVSSGNLSEARMLIEQGADINERDYSKFTLLINASRRNDIEMTRLLIEKGADINAKGYGGGTALIDAAIVNHIDMVKLLIDSGADIEAKDRWERTALIRAAGEGHTEMVNLLLEKGAVINSKSKRNWTAIMEALSRQQFAIAKLIINKSGTFKDNFGPLTLMVAAHFGTDEIVDLLLAAGVDVNSRGNYGETALIATSQFDRISIIKLLLKKGADVNAKSSHGETALMKVAVVKHQNGLEAMRILIDHGADTNAKDNIGWTALIRATKIQNNEMVEFLLKKGAVPDDSQNIGATALEIVEPKEGQTFEAGSKIRLLVKPKHGEQWKTLSLASVLPDDSLFVPYSFWQRAYVKDIRIPIDASPQHLEINVFALSKEDLSVWLKRKINIVLPINVTLQGISVDPTFIFLQKMPPGSDPNKVRAYETGSIGVGGIYSDGIKRNITASSNGTTYTSSNENVAKISPDGEITAHGIGDAIVTVRNGEYYAQVKIKVKPYETL